MLKKGLLFITALALLALVGQASAGPNANAVLSLDIDASDNKMDDGNTSGTVEGAGTDVVVEVFITGLAGPISGGTLSFNTDMLTVKSVAVGAGFLLGTTDQTASIGILPAATLTNGHFATVTFTTASDVTGREFTVGASVNNLAAGDGSTDMLTAATSLTFNASTTQPPMPPTPPTPMPPTSTVGPALDIGTSSNGMNDGNVSINAEAGSTVVVEVFAGANLSPIGGGSITFSQAIGEVNFAQDNWQIVGGLKDGGKKVDFSALNGGLATLNAEGFLGAVSFTVASVPATISIEQLVLAFESGADTLSVSNVAVTILPPTQFRLTASEEMATIPYGGSAMITLTAEGFAEDAFIDFTVDPDVLERLAEGAVLTLTATSAATVTVTASVGEDSTNPVTVEFVEGPRPPVVLTASEDMATIPYGGSAMITLTAEGFAEDASIDFTVDPADAVEMSQEGAVLTLTATSATTVTVTASVGEDSTNPVTVEFVEGPRPPHLISDRESPVTIPHDSSVTVTVTAVDFDESSLELGWDLPAGAVVRGNTVTLTVSDAATVTVRARDDSNNQDELTIEFLHAPYLEADTDMVLVHRDSSVATGMATVTAMGFDEDADINFTVEPMDAVVESQEGAVLTLTASDATTVMVTASDGRVTTSPISIEFQLDPYLRADKDSPVEIPPDSVVVKVTAMDYPADANISFDSSQTSTEGDADTDLVEFNDDKYALLTVSGSGSTTVTVEATDGTTTRTVTIQFIQPVKLELSEELSDSLISTLKGSVTGTVTALHFPDDAALDFGVEVVETEDGAEVESSQDGAVLTLIASGSGSATVTVTVSSDKYEHLTVDPITLQFIHPRLVADADSLIIEPGSTAVATIVAKDFPADADVQFELTKDVDKSESVTIDQQIRPREVVLTVQGSGSATVTVRASSGEGEDLITAAPAIIQFDPPDPPDPPGPQPALVSDADEYVIPPDGNVVATLTAMNFPEGADIVFNWITVNAEGPEVTIDEALEDSVLTLTASGSGTAKVEVRARGGAISVADTIQFIQPSLMLTSDIAPADSNQVLIPHNASATVTVTAEGSLPTGATVDFTWTPEDGVEGAASEDSDTLTLTSSSAATVTVSASAADGKITADPITIRFTEPQPRLVSDVGDAVVIPLAGSVVATITAIDFPADADVQFELTKDVDESVTIDQQIRPREVVLTVQGSGSATVTVRASSGEGENMITASATIRFDHARLVSDSDANKYVIPPDSSVVATITAVGFPEDVGITYSWVRVVADGPEVTIDETVEGEVLTLTARGSGEVTVMVQGTGGDITREITIQFGQPLPPDPPDPPGLSVDQDVSDEIVTLPGGGIPAIVRVTAENFPADAEITFQVEVLGDLARVEHSQDGAVLTLEVTGPGAAIVTVTATDGTTTLEKIIQFDEQVAVELSSFVGEVVEKRVVLNWTTVSQTNNAGFRVLRSTDQETYEVVSELIAGAGTTDQLMDYTFEDANLPAVELVYYVLEQIDIDGTVHRSDPIEVLLGARFLLPTEFASSVYPNPFNPSTTISYDLPVDADVSIVIYDAIGQEIRQLVSEYRAAGRYNVRWDSKDHLGRSVGSGVYIAKIKAGQHTALQKMLLLK